MPELPEVEIMTRALGRWTRGRRLSRLDVLDTALELPVERVDGVVGGAVGAAWRRAKYAVLELSGASLVLHFRMTGKLLQRAGGEPAPAGARLSLILDDDTAVDFVDPRRLGTAWLLDDEALAARLSSLGPEPWPERHDGGWWRVRLSGLRGPVKPALLKQDRVAGIGNILACESLWRAGVDPRRRVPDLTDSDWDGLAVAIPDAIDHVLAVEEPLHDAQGSIAYVNQGGPNPFSVYGRAGEPCPRCQSPIVRLTQAGRGTWWCPGCQR